MERDDRRAFLRMGAQMENVPAAVEFSRLFFEAVSVPEGGASFSYALQLMVSEALTNVVKHAYAGREPGEMELELFTADDRAGIVVRDDGVPFNPECAPEPDFETQAGSGLGIFIMRRHSDRLDYSCRDGRNTLVMEKRFEK